MSKLTDRQKYEAVIVFEAMDLDSKSEFTKAAIISWVYDLILAQRTMQQAVR